MSMLSRRREEPEVSMSPLIDCVFLLLIFFLVSTMMKQDNKDIDILLPESESALGLKPDDDIVVVGIDHEKTLYLEGQPTTLTQLLTSLAELSITDPDQRIRLDVDRRTSFERVVEVLDLLQFRGLTNVGIRTYDEHYNR